MLSTFYSKTIFPEVFENLELKLSRYLPTYEVTLSVLEKKIFYASEGDMDVKIKNGSNQELVIKSAKFHIRVHFGIL